MKKLSLLFSGIGSAAARVAALIAPFIGDWLETSPIVPYILVGEINLQTFSLTKSIDAQMVVLVPSQAIYCLVLFNFWL